MRLIVAVCSVEYEGRLAARLPAACRLVVIKRDGSIAVHSDSRAYKPLNWMSPPCTLRDGGHVLVGSNAKGELLRIELHEVLHDHRVELEDGGDPGLEKDGVEAELQELIAARVSALGRGLTLVRREFPTDIGPVDLLCRDGEGRAVAVEIKRVGEIGGVEQLLRYVGRLDRDARFAPTRGLLAAARVKPQARAYARSHGVDCVEVDVEELRGGAAAPLRLF